MKSKKPFNIHLYKLNVEEGSKPLEDILKMIVKSPLDDRERKLFSQPYRLEDACEPTVKEPYWLIDFTKTRYEGGPGRASSATPVEGFAMAGGYGFAEETAALYDASAGYMVVQYNHHGPRAQAIGEYLSCYDPEQANNYELLLQLNPDAQTRLNNKKIFTRLKIRVAPSKISSAYREANISLVTALESQAKEFGGDVVTVEVSLDRQNNGSLKLKKWLEALISLANSEHEAVDVLTISGRDGVDYPIDPVDLIKERLRTVIKDMPLDDSLRYPQMDRYKALKRAYNGWKNVGIIT